MIEAAVARLAAAERLLVASDFDGVLAPLVDDPNDARPQPASIEALQRLAHCGQTHVAVVSGRDLAVLRRLLGPHDDFMLAGSHGAELEAGAPTAAERRLLQTFRSRLVQAMSGIPGAHVEDKPFSVAAHYRRVPGPHRDRASAAVEEIVARWPHKVVRGKDVVELMVRAATKGDAILSLRRRLAPTLVVYLGDDVTDEDAFEVLGPDDVGVKVGPGETIAGHRLEDPSAVGLFLAALADARQLRSARSSRPEVGRGGR